MNAAGKSSRAVLAWLGHPVTLVALAVLIVNDHVLKAAWPGLITGKLSDFAGLVLAPPLLAVLVTLVAPRLALRPLVISSLVTVGVGFTLAKIVGVPSPIWAVRADLADLIALPALLASYLVFRRTRPVSSYAVRVFRVGVVLPVALLGVIATSPVQHPDANSIGIDAEDRILTDGSVVEEDGQVAPRRSYESSEVRMIQREQDCLGLLCYRVVPGRLAVQRSDDGGDTWVTAWEVSERARAVLAREYQDLGQPWGGRLESQSIVVQGSRGNGHIVVVANGRDGYLVRDVSGAWTRIGFGLAPPPAIHESWKPAVQWFVNLPVQMLFGFMLAVSLFALGVSVTAIRDGSLVIGIATMALTVCGSAFAALFWQPLFDGDGLEITMAVVFIVGLPALLFPLGYFAQRQEIFRPRVKRDLVLMSVAFGVLGTLPFAAWTGAAIVDVRTAFLTSLAVALVGAVVVAQHGFRALIAPH